MGSHVGTDIGQGDTLINAVLGAGVTVVLSRTDFSPALGGGVAGYPAGKPGKRDKGRSPLGAFALVPVVLFMVFFVGISMVGPVTGGGMPGGFVFLFAVPFVLAWHVGLGALGVDVREELESTPQ